MKKREIGNLALHVTVGGAFAAAVAWAYWCIIPVTFIWAFLREQAQHRYILTDTLSGTPRRYLVKKRTFWDFGWLNRHRFGEVCAWTVGSALGLFVFKLLDW